MFGVQYADRSRGWENTSRSGQYEEEVDEVDYSFSKLPVRERRKLFMNDPAPSIIQQYGTLPRTQETQRIWSTTESRSEVNELGPQSRRSLAPKIQAHQRPSSVYAGQKNVSRGFAQDYNYPQKDHSYFVSEQQIKPSYATPRLSRQSYGPQISTSTIRPTESFRNYTSPGTRVIPSRRLSVSTGSRERESTSMGRDVWPEAQPNAQVGRPLRVRVYNSDRNALSPNYAQSVSNWTPTSPVYPAYPAYGSRSADGNTQIYRVVQSPRKSYPMDAEPLSISKYSSSQIYAPPLSRQLGPNSKIRMQEDSMKVYQTLPKQSSTAVFQPNPPIKNWIQPARVNTVQASQPWKQYEQMRPQEYTPHRQVVNRRPPPPDDEMGVSEF